MQAVGRAVSCLTVSRRLPVQYNSSSCSCFCAYSVLAWRFNWLPRCQRLGTRATYTRRVSHQRVCTRFTPLPRKAAPYMTYTRSHMSSHSSTRSIIFWIVYRGSPVACSAKYPQPRRLSKRVSARVESNGYLQL